MTQKLRDVLATVFMYLNAVYYCAADSIGTTPSVCDYTSPNLYIVNRTATLTLFPTGYVSCLNATGSDIAVCKNCSCRESKIGSVAGVTVAGVVCVGSGNAATCVGQDQEYCFCNDSAGCTGANAVLRDGARNDEDMKGDDDVSVISSDGLTSGSDMSAESNSASTTAEFTKDDTSSSTDSRYSLDTSNGISSSDASLNLDVNRPTSIPAVTPGLINSSIDAYSGSTGIDVDSGNPVVASEPAIPSIDTEKRDSFAIDASTDIEKRESVALDASTDSALKITDSSKGVRNSSSTDIIASLKTMDVDESSNESTVRSTRSNIDFGSDLARPFDGSDNAVSGTVETAKSYQTDAAYPIDQNSSQLQDDESKAFDINNTASTKSSWSGERLTAVISAMCGVGVVAAVAAYVAMRKIRSKNINEIGTPTDDYTDDNKSMMTPTNRGKSDARYYGGGQHNAGSVGDTPLVSSIAVIGSNDDFSALPSSASERQYQSYSDARGNAFDDVATQDNRPSYATIQQQFVVSHGPSVADSPTSNLIFDTCSTQVSFSSERSSQFDIPSDKRSCESETSFNSFQMSYGSASSCGNYCDLAVLSNASYCQASSLPDSEMDAAGLSFASLESVQYEIRDTEASEHMYGLEMNRNSSSVSFDTELI